MSEIYNFTVKDIDGKDVSLSQYQDKVMVIVNTASQCGLTPQYKYLEEIYQKYKDRGLVILGFPCNQFGSQEKGSESEIKTFCETHFSVSFPLFSKIEVNGDGTIPLYQYLKEEMPGLLGSKSIKWNFTKFLVDKKGRSIKRFAPKASPLEMVPEIEKLLE